MNKDEKIIKLCNDFVTKKEEYENFQTNLKKHFYLSMGKFFKTGESKIQAFHGNSGFEITKVIRTSIQFDTSKLKQALKPEIYKSITKKEVKVNNSIGLLHFLKESNIDIKKLKKYISITDSVDEKKLEQKLALGEVSKNTVTKCSKIVCSEPYFMPKAITKEE